MTLIGRRGFSALLGAGALALAAPRGRAAPALAQAQPKAVVIGGGFGGATAAKYLRLLDPGLDVTLIEPKRAFHTCPFSNLVLGGLRDMGSIRHGYEALRLRHGVAVVHETATAIDAERKTVALSGGGSVAYDRLIVSPGIDLRFDAIPGYDEAAAERMPHAWKAGAQTELLARQLAAMKDGGVVVIAAPPNPYRCPPGPYERAGLIAHYLKTNKPRSKVLILDPKENFSKQGLFLSGWKTLYGDMIEWVPASQDGKVIRVDAAAMTLESDFGEIHRGDVVNFIPPQRAGAIAAEAGLTDASGWCPVEFTTFESSLRKGIHVVGDAAIAPPMPKSGFAANSQAKIAAAAVAALLRGRAPDVASLANTCYSLVGPDYGISVTGVYRPQGDKLVELPGTGGVSPADAPASFREQEARYAEGWYASITADMFA